MFHVLIAYESKYGQTEKIAQFIAQRIREQGHEADLLECHDHQKDFLGFSKYDAVIIGGAVYAQGYPRRIQKWTKTHAEALNKLPSAFFSVCLGILEADPAVQRQEREIVQGFFRKTKWTPAKWTIFAGGLPYSKYNWIVRSFMKQIAKREGASTDVSRDYEYTNWSEVKSFTDEFLASIPKLPIHYEMPSRGDITSLEF